MSGSTFGKIFKITTWGESHGAGIGVVIDGCPAGLLLDESDIQKFLDRRKPGSSQYATQRKEADCVEILSGVFEGRTTGTPISMIVHNTSHRTSDYREIASYYRPGHADLHLIKNMVFEITAVGDALLDVKQLAGLQQVRLPQNCCQNLELLSQLIHRQLVI